MKVFSKLVTPKLFTAFDLKDAYIQQSLFNETRKY